MLALICRAQLAECLVALVDLVLIREALNLFILAAVLRCAEVLKEGLPSCQYGRVIRVFDFT